MEYFWSQFFTILSYLFLLLVYTFKNRKLILPLNILASLTLAISYLFLKEYTGYAANIFAIFRAVMLTLDFKFKNQKAYDIALLSVFFTAITLIAIFTYQAPYSLLSVLATYIYTFSIWQKNRTWFNILGIPACLCYIIYNIFAGSVFGIVCESVVLVYIIIQLILIAVKTNRNKKNISEIKNENSL